MSAHYQFRGPATFRFKGAALDLNQLRASVPDAELGDEPNTLKFRSPGGHMVTTPYDATTIAHHKARLGGDPAYYQALGQALQSHGKRVDQDVEEDRDAGVAARRSGNTLLGSTLGGSAGALAGLALGKGRGGAALIGGALGALGGGYLGHGRKVDRESGPTERHLEEEKHLYQEPAHVKALKQRLETMDQNLAYMRNQQDIDPWNDHMNPRYRHNWQSRVNDPYYGPYYNR